MRNATPCPNWREQLSAYQDRALSPKETRRVEAHLAACDMCREALAQLDHDRARFQAAYAQEKVDLRDRVLAAVRPEAPAKARESALLTRLRWALGGTAAVALVSVVLLAAVLLGRDPASISLQVQRQLATGLLSYAQDNQEVQLPADWAPSSEVPTRPSIRSRSKKLGEAPDYAFNANLAGAIDANERSDYAKDILTGNGAARFGRNVAYDIGYRLQTRDALKRAREAQALIVKHGGFTMQFQYAREDGQPAWATFNGKIPAAQADGVLAEMERLGTVRGLTIAGEDLTERMRQQADTAQRQQQHADALNKIGNRATAKVAAGVENNRSSAAGQADAARRALSTLKTREKLVTITAEFVEGQPRQPLTLAAVADGTRHVLNYALLLLTTVAVMLLVLALLAAPFVALRFWRRRKAA